MPHQDEGQRDTDAVVRYALQQRAVCLVAVELGDFEVCRLPVVGLVVQRFDGYLSLHLVEPVCPGAQRLVAAGVHLLMPLRHALVGQGYHGEAG